MSSRTVLTKINIVLIDATLFAYLIIPLNFLLLFGLLTKFLGHSNSNCFLPSYFLADLSLAAIFWAVSFFAFLFPLPTICFFAWNLYTYVFLGEAQTQHLILIVGYGSAVVVALLLKTIWSEVLHFSPGRWLFNGTCNGKQAVSPSWKKHPSKWILSLLMASELVQALQEIVFYKEEFPNEQAVTAEVGIGTDVAIISTGKKVVSVIVLVLMIVGLGLSSQWKLPLQVKQSNLEHRVPVSETPGSFPAREASKC